MGTAWVCRGVSASCYRGSLSLETIAKGVRRAWLVSLVTALGCTTSANEPVGATWSALADDGGLASSRATVDGGEDPAAVCPPGTHVILGTEGDDELYGTRGRDCILGLGGNDILHGKRGRDHLYGGPGDDRLLGGSGRDHLFGGAGCDVLDGNGWRDSLEGGDGSDVLQGGRWPARVLGGDGDDFLGFSRRWRSVVDGGSGVDSCRDESCELPAVDTCHVNRPGRVTLDFERDTHDRPLSAGTRVSRQWRQYGVSFVCKTRRRSHPNACLIFDSGTPTGGDYDLGTPNESFGGPGRGAGGEAGAPGENAEGLQNVLILAENVRDRNRDGLVDSPDDAYSGGWFRLYFDDPVTVESLQLLDMGRASTVSCVAFDGSVTTHEPAVLGENSVQTLMLNCTDVVELEIALRSSGGIASLTYVGHSCASGEECLAGLCVPENRCDACTPISDSDTTCDGVDDDCDGLIDDEVEPQATTCGIGACSAGGVTSCVDGVPSDSCVPGTAGPNDLACDGIDSDCDGAVDESFVALVTTCGVGACAAAGVTSCVGGALADSCIPLSSAPSDLTCDGIDDDCDGSLDEDYVPQPAACGVGACASVGFTTCVGGAVENTCEAGTPAPADATCDGLDEDCDASTDEDYVESATSCGVGACGATGTRTCVSGVEYDSCRVVTQAFDDATCDGVDDDCDGVPDEDCCEPLTCADVGATCGNVSNGCGGVLSCGNCFGAGEVCGGGNACRPELGVVAGPDQATVWGELIVVGDDLFLSRATDGLATTSVIDCVWDFGDGSVVDRPNCKFPGILAAAHAYQNPGTYTVTLTATTPGGATDADTLTVTVLRRPSAVLVESVSGGAGGTAVTARLFDGTAADVVMEGSEIGIAADGATISGAVDAEGRLAGLLPLASGSTALVTASFAGDALYEPSSSTTTVRVAGDGAATILSRPANGHEGRRFMLGFTQNGRNHDTRPRSGETDALFVHLSSAVSQVVTLRAPGIGYEAEVPVLAGVGRRVTVPTELRMGPAMSSESVLFSESGLIQNHGLELEGSAPFGVHAMDQIRDTTDGYLGLPVDRLGREYIVLAYPNEKLIGGFQQSGGTQIGIVATEDGTEVTITPSRNVAPGVDLPMGIPAGTTAVVTLNAGQTLQLANQGGTGRPGDFEDLSGTEIRSNQPVAVFAGHACATIVEPTCGHLIEQLPPVDAWGRRFFTAPLAMRIENDVFRLVASRDDTMVSVDGQPLATLDRGQTHFFEVASDRSVVVEATQPILLAQHARGQGLPVGGEDDPFMMLVPPAEQYASEYRMITPTGRRVAGGDDGFQHYLGLLVQADKASGVRVNGRFISPLWRPAGDSGWVGAQIQVGDGSLFVDHVEGDVPVGLLAYGFGQFDSYGYPGGWRFGARACELTTTTPGDGADNDCDGRSDEELPNGIDDDGDGLTDEDLLLPSIVENLPPVAESFRAFAQASDGNTSRPGGPYPLKTSTYALRGHDPNGDSLTFEMVTPPRFSDAVVVGRSLRFTAIRSNLRPPGWTGTETVVVRAFDGQLYSDVATVTLDVGPGVSGQVPCDGPGCGNVGPVVLTNRAFVVSLAADATSAELVDQLEVYDANRDPLTFTLVDGPAGLTLDAQTGAVRWTVTPADVGDHPISVDVTDGRINSPVRWSRFVRVSRDG